MFFRSERRKTAPGMGWTRFMPRRVRAITRLDVAVTGLVGTFLCAFYAVNLFNDFATDWLFAFAVLRFLGALAVVGLVVLLRDRFPLWIGYLGAVAELTAFVYFVGFTINHEQVVFRLQEFPLIALYLAWRFSHWVTRLTVYPVMLATVGIAIWLGPAAGTDHELGPLNVLSLFFFTFVGMYVGAAAKHNVALQTEFDELTGAVNRRGLGLRGDKALAAVRKLAQPLCVALIDLDGFKEINDGHGHAAGDEVLIELVRHLQSSTREQDIVARLGGDEFVVVLPRTALAQAEASLERIHASSAHRWSYGVAQATEEDNLSTVILRADRAMYTLKRERAEARAARRPREQASG